MQPLYDSCHTDRGTQFNIDYDEELERRLHPENFAPIYEFDPDLGVVANGKDTAEFDPDLGIVPVEEEEYDS